MDSIKTKPAPYRNRRDAREIIAEHIEQLRQLMNELTDNGRPLNQMEKDLLRSCYTSELNGVTQELKFAFYSGDNTFFDTCLSTLQEIKDSVL